MKQLTFADTEYAGKRKQARKESFQIEMEPVMPWRSKQPSAASTMAARVFAASSLVLRMAVRLG